MRALATIALSAAIAAGMLCGCGEAPGSLPPGSLDYGFRYDPMRYVENASSLEAAKLRTFVFRRPKPGDSEIIDARIAEILARQGQDGAFPDPHHQGVPASTGERLIELLELGCPPERVELKRAAEAILAELRKQRLERALNKAEAEKPEPLSCYAAHALARMGYKGLPEVKAAVRWRLDHPEEYIGHVGCPWTPAVQLESLWACREVANVLPVLDRGLKWIADDLNAAGCWSYNDPWGYVGCAAAIDRPLSRTILGKQIGLILRGQQRDGGWGARSYDVLRALARHKLLEPLRKAPPLPSDWRVVRSIPAPQGSLFTMACDGERLWVRDTARNEALAVSVEDGKVVRRIKLPVGNVFGIGWWDGGLAVSTNKPKRVVKVNARTGKIEREVRLPNSEWVQGVGAAAGKLLVADGFNCCVYKVDPYRPQDARSFVLAGPGPISLAVAGETVWHFDFWAPAVIESRLDGEGRLVSWGEKPFGGAVRGLAWDGERLWALDGRAKRICVIDKAPADRPRHDWLADAAQVRASPLFVTGDRFEAGRLEVEIDNAAALPATLKVRFAPHKRLRAAPAELEAAVGANATATVAGEVRAAPTAALKDLSPLGLRWTVSYAAAGGEPQRFNGRCEVRVLRKHLCPRAAGRITVDGRLDDWADLPFEVTKPAELLNAAAAHRGAKDCSFHFGVACDERYLYVAVRTTDDRLYLDPRKKVWQQDGVEVRLSALPEPRRSRVGGPGIEWRDVLPILVSPAPKGERRPGMPPPAGMLCWQAARWPKGTKVGCVRTADGHNTEIAVPASYLDERQGGKWREFRLNVAVDDYDAEDSGAQLWWRPDWRRDSTYPGSGTFRRE